MKSMRAAVRRQRTERIKKRVQNLYGGWAKDNPRVIGLLTNTRVLCSCNGCGNPRKHFGELSRQERRALDAAYDEISRVFE